MAIGSALSTLESTRFMGTYVCLYFVLYVLFSCVLLHGFLLISGLRVSGGDDVLHLSKNRTSVFACSCP